MKTLTVVLFDPKLEFGYLSLEEKLNLIEAKFKEAYAVFMTDNPDRQNAIFLFVCPEYTFMNLESRTTHLSYSKAEIKSIKTRLTKLISAFPNAILVPGTAYEKKELAENKEKYTDFIKTGLRENNERVPTGMSFFEAWKKSNVSAVKNTAHIFGKISHGKKPLSHSYSKRGDAMEKFINASLYPGKSADAIFTVNGLRIGIEICADHQEKLLGLQQDKNAELLDIHLLIGNVVSLNKTNVANHGKNIIVINCAGYFSENPTAQRETGIWIGDEKGELHKLNPNEASTANLYFYPNIALPNQDKKAITSPSLNNSHG